MNGQIQKVSYDRKRVRDVYRKKAAIYDIWGRLAESKARRIGLSRINIQDGESVLEVAVGTGLMFREILIRNPHGKNEGIDLTEAMLEKAREKARGSGVNNYNLTTGDAYRLSYTDESFDLLVNNYMFDLLPEEDFDRVLGEFHRVMKRGARLLLINMTFGRAPWQRFYELVYRTDPGSMGLCRGVELADRLPPSGFADVKRAYVSQLGFPSEILTARRI